MVQLSIHVNCNPKYQCSCSPEIIVELSMTHQTLEMSLIIVIQSQSFTTEFPGILSSWMPYSMHTFSILKIHELFPSILISQLIENMYIRITHLCRSIFNSRKCRRVASPLNLLNRLWSACVQRVQRVAESNLKWNDKNNNVTRESHKSCVSDTPVVVLWLRNPTGVPSNTLVRYCRTILSRTKYTNTRITKQRISN